jgi:hypothetical protein
VVQCDLNRRALQDVGWSHRQTETSTRDEGVHLGWGGEARAEKGTTWVEKKTTCIRVKEVGAME